MVVVTQVCIHLSNILKCTGRNVFKLSSPKDYLNQHIGKPRLRAVKELAQDHKASKG